MRILPLVAAILASFETIAPAVPLSRTVRTIKLKSGVSTDSHLLASDIFASASVCEAGVVCEGVCVPELACKDSRGGVQLCLGRAIFRDFEVNVGTGSTCPSEWFTTVNC